MLLPPVGIHKMSIDLSLRRNPIRWDKTAITFVRSWDSKEGVAGETRQERARLINTKRIGDSFIVESTPSFLLAAQQQEKSRHFPFFSIPSAFRIGDYLSVNKQSYEKRALSIGRQPGAIWLKPPETAKGVEGRLVCGFCSMIIGTIPAAAAALLSSCWAFSIDCNTIT